MIDIWLKLKGYIIAAGVFLALVVGMFFKGRASGRADAVAKQREVDDEARKRISLVKPATSDDVDDSLRDGKF